MGSLILGAFLFKVKVGGLLGTKVQHSKLSLIVYYPCSTKVNKANRILGTIRRSYKYLDENTLKHANAVWNPMTMKQIELIEGVQRRGTKLVPSLKHMSYENWLKTLKLPTLRFRRLRGDMIETYKILHSIYDPEVSDNILELSKSTNTRGHNLKLFARHSNSNIRKFYFNNCVVEPWNSLPPSVVNAPSLNAGMSARGWQRWQLSPCPCMGVAKKGRGWQKCPKM